MFMLLMSIRIWWLFFEVLCVSDFYVLGYFSLMKYLLLCIKKNGVFWMCFWKKRLILLVSVLLFWLLMKISWLFLFVMYGM